MDLTLATKRGSTLHATIDEKGKVSLAEFTFDGYNREKGILFGLKDGKPGRAELTDESNRELAAVVTAVGKAAYLAREAALELAVPGITKLRAAREDEARYSREFTRMMEDESNDGVFPPAKPAADSHVLAGEFPRAALYLKAESYSCAANDRKATAGSKAMAILADGGSETDARAVLDNWLPASAYTD